MRLLVALGTLYWEPPPEYMGAIGRGSWEFDGRASDGLHADEMRPDPQTWRCVDRRSEGSQANRIVYRTESELEALEWLVDRWTLDPSA